jgi:hypothetical protein
MLDVDTFELLNNGWHYWAFSSKELKNPTVFMDFSNKLFNNPSYLNWVGHFL